MRSIPTRNSHLSTGAVFRWWVNLAASLACLLLPAGSSNAQGIDDLARVGYVRGLSPANLAGEIGSVIMTAGPDEKAAIFSAVGAAYQERPGDYHGADFATIRRLHSACLLLAGHDLSNADLLLGWLDENGDSLTDADRSLWLLDQLKTDPSPAAETWRQTLCVSALADYQVMLADGGHGIASSVGRLASHLAGSDCQNLMQAAEAGFQRYAAEVQTLDLRRKDDLVRLRSWQRVLAALDEGSQSNRGEMVYTAVLPILTRKLAAPSGYWGHFYETYEILVEPIKSDAAAEGLRDSILGGGRVDLDIAAVYSHYLAGKSIELAAAQSEEWTERGAAEEIPGDQAAGWIAATGYLDSLVLQGASDPAVHKLGASAQLAISLAQSDDVRKQCLMRIIQTECAFYRFDRAGLFLTHYLELFDDPDTFRLANKRFINQFQREVIAESGMVGE